MGSASSRIPKASPSPDAIVPFGFRFEDCASAAEVFRARLPALVETVRAMAIAELEADGRYVEADHDPFFEGFGDHALTPDDLALFPDYLVCIPPDRNAAPENANLIEMLSSGLPVKVLVETRDLLEESAVGAGHFAFGVRSVRLGMTAMGLGGVYVVQTPSSNLLGLRAPIAQGFDHRGPALFSVYSGASDPAASISQYLSAAAAVESRAFPPFSYDPLAGDNLAARFSLENCPQPEDDWPVEPFEYADEEWQRVTERAGVHLCRLRAVRPAPRRAFRPRAQGALERRACGPSPNGSRSTRRRWPNAFPTFGPSTRDDVLHRVLVDARLIGAVRRCRTLWHRLREQGGIHNSHAEQLLAREKAAWEAEKQRQIDELKAAATPMASGEARSQAGERRRVPLSRRSPPRRPRTSPPTRRTRPGSRPRAAPAATNASSSTTRCSSTTRTSRRISATSRRAPIVRLVEAAESCQVSIIHPGKPFNPNEPGLDELVERAKAFQ